MNIDFDTTTKYIKLSFAYKEFISDYIRIYFKVFYNKPESYIKTRWRNGSVFNTGNTKAIACTEIINNYYADKAYIIIDRPLSQGHKYRYQYSTFSISSGLTMLYNITDKSISRDVTIVSDKYIQEINLTDGSIGFAIAIYELDENDEYVPLRIDTVDTNNIYIFRTWKDQFSGYTSNVMVRDVLVDLNDYTEAGFYSFNNGCTFVNIPEEISNVASTVKVLKVYELPTTNIPIYQEVIQPSTGFTYIRYRTGGGTWSSWKRINPNNILSIIFTNPILSKIDLNFKASKILHQEIAVYNDYIFSFGQDVMSINGGNTISINCGHGNNAMFGKVLHGDFPYLYCGSWDYNDNYITVNEISSTTVDNTTTYTVTTVRTITFSTLTGHLNMVVDEPNDKIYILMNKDNSTHVGNINFVVAELSTGTILSQKDLDYTIPVIQGMEFHNGVIYVTHGGVSPDIENYISILDINGDRISMSDPINIGEIEGISFSNGYIYIANGNTVWC